MITPVEWKNNQVVLLDQRLLPVEEKYVTLNSVDEVAEAILDMTVRGAPAIGVTAAMGVALGALHLEADDFSGFVDGLQKICLKLKATRPTAVNLEWGLDQMMQVVKQHTDSPIAIIRQNLIEKAKQIKEDDIAINRKIGSFGEKILDSGDTVLTHCNAGALATAGFGTALGVIYAAQEAGKKIHVYADETRPVLQGARLSAWELQKNNVPVTVITDNMAASLMRDGKIQKVIVGADRIAANGDVANKIGTYSVAINAHYHNIPFYVAAPYSTIDMNTARGADIVIEERHSEEVSKIGNKQLTPKGVKIYNPAFDVTPNELIKGIITEKGIVKKP
jgi:methylthioribose-1-phosphate isomerase